MRAELIDLLCCHVYALASLAGGAWFYWQLSLPLGFAMC